MFFSELGQNIDLHFGSMVMLSTKSLIAVVANKASNLTFPVICFWLFAWKPLEYAFYH